MTPPDGQIPQSLFVVSVPIISRNVTCATRTSRRKRPADRSGSGKEQEEAVNKPVAATTIGRKRAAPAGHQPGTTAVDQFRQPKRADRACYCQTFGCNGKRVPHNTFFTHQKIDAGTWNPNPRPKRAGRACDCRTFGCKGKTVPHTVFYEHKKKDAGEWAAPAPTPWGTRPCPCPKCNGKRVGKSAFFDHQSKRRRLTE